jgi:hypothetical protein
MRVLLGCEYSRVVSEAFEARGHYVLSCDLLKADVRGEHLTGDLRLLIEAQGLEVEGTERCMEVVSKLFVEPWDLAIFHPPCTYLTCSAEWAYKDPDYKRYPEVGYHQKVKEGTLVGALRREARKEAVSFCKFLMGAPIKKIAMENPRGHLSSAYRPADQTIQPYQFGNDASKATCLWLKGLPPLKGTKYIKPRITKGGKERWANQTDGGQNKLPPTKDRWKIRSETYPGIAAAMAQQWG